MGFAGCRSRCDFGSDSLRPSWFGTVTVLDFQNSHAPNGGKVAKRDGVMKHRRRRGHRCRSLGGERIGVEAREGVLVRVGRRRVVAVDGIRGARDRVDHPDHFVDRYIQ